MKLSINDFDNICRFCLKKENEFIDSIISDSVIKMILDCINIMVFKTDEFPQKICSTCLNKLNFSYKFRQRCLQTNMILKNIKDKSRINKKDKDFVSISDPDTDLSSKNKNSMSINIDSNIESDNIFWDTVKEMHSSEEQTGDGENEDRITVTVVNTLTGLSSEDATANNCKEHKSSELNNYYKKGKHLMQKFLCPICGILTNQHINQHMTKHIEKRFKCNLCDRAFAQQVNFKRHMIIHTGNKPFKCEICDKSFASPIYLKSHTVTHTKERNYQCDLCGKSFGYPRVLSAHKRSHAQDRKISCSVCQKMFLTQSGLKKHMRIHTGEKPYKCDFCFKQFTTSYNMRSHRRTHTKERPFKCSICELDFAYRSVLNLHMKKIHSIDSNSS